MPIYDRTCQTCDMQFLDVFEPINTTDVPCIKCGSPTNRIWLGKAASISSDSCDVMVRHGICNSDGTPRRYTSKSDMAKEAKKRGLENHVVHLGSRGSDKSKYTVKWV